MCGEFPLVGRLYFQYLNCWVTAAAAVSLRQLLCVAPFKALRLTQYVTTCMSPCVLLPQGRVPGRVPAIACGRRAPPVLPPQRVLRARGAVLFRHLLPHLPRRRRCVRLGWVGGLGGVGWSGVEWGE